MNIVQEPTNEAADEGKDLFYDKLQGVVEKLPKNMNIVVGDLNANVGVDNRSNEEVMGMHGLGGGKRQWGKIYFSVLFQPVGHRRDSLTPPPSPFPGR
ncbi:hypothetical protein ElyMa_003573900 [Elysia marginata]|uniref:Endonuclease/exonuclease/phosphatase domain-containing protein n=1 Tax=Elysia marginata TaxID=1093978 RepID=A0AAV4EMJ7_9GAST|nr:hypothetical protein ElyMa_003573900 [Elysia marginata]